MSPTPPASPPPLSAADEALVRELAPSLRSVVETTPPLTLDEIGARAPSVRTTAPSTTTLAWRLAAAAAVVLVLVGVGLAWRARDDDQTVVGLPAGAEPLTIPADPTGPIPAFNTAANTGEIEGTSPARWDVVRTGGDDRQLVVYFDGGGCGTYRADVIETDDTVSIQIQPAVDALRTSECLTIAGPGAIGIQLDQPLGTRRVEGSRASPGNEVPGPLVVPGPDLATLTWPPGSERAATEDLHRGLGPESWVWTQRFEAPGSNVSDTQRVSLEQWHGATPIDEGALFQACLFGRPSSTEPVDLDGVEATLVRCGASPSDSSRPVAILWMDGTDRLMVRAEAGSDLDAKAVVGLARSVRRGG